MRKWGYKQLFGINYEGGYVSEDELDKYGELGWQMTSGCWQKSKSSGVAHLISVMLKRQVQKTPRRPIDS